MKAKICMLLIAIVAMFVFVSVGCEKASASVSVGQTQHEPVIATQEVTPAHVAVDIALPTGTRQHAVASARVYLTLDTYDVRNFREQGLSYQYNFDGRRAKPPAFNGLGGDHFARADV